MAIRWSPQLACHLRNLIFRLLTSLPGPTTMQVNDHNYQHSGCLSSHSSRATNSTLILMIGSRVGEYVFQVPILFYRDQLSLEVCHSLLDQCLSLLGSVIGIKPKTRILRSRFLQFALQHCISSTAPMPALTLSGISNAYASMRYPVINPSNSKCSTIPIFSLNNQYSRNFHLYVSLSSICSVVSYW